MLDFTVFTFEETGKQVRGYLVNGKAWFSARDLCEALLLPSLTESKPDYSGYYRPIINKNSRCYAFSRPIGGGGEIRLYLLSLNGLNVLCNVTDAELRDAIKAAAKTWGEALEAEAPKPQLAVKDTVEVSGLEELNAKVAQMATMLRDIHNYLRGQQPMTNFLLTPHRQASGPN